MVWWIHWWIQVWEVLSLQKRGCGWRKWVVRAVLLKGVWGPWPWPATLLGFLAIMMWAALFLHTHQPQYSASPQSRTRQPALRGWNPLKPRARINFPSFKLLASDTCHGDEKSDACCNLVPFSSLWSTQASRPQILKFEVWQQTRRFLFSFPWLQTDDSLLPYLSYDFP